MIVIQETRHSVYLLGIEATLDYFVILTKVIYNFFKNKYQRGGGAGGLVKEAEGVN